jgi:hypothetical protein
MHIKKPLLILLILCIIFFLLKLSTNSIRASDTNIYFYTGKLLLEGKILYRDVFFTNFPLLPYIAALYYLLLQGNLLFYYLTASIEIIFISIVMFFIVINQTKNVFLGISVVVLYLFSFIILATSDHQTGVFLASLFAVISYFFFQKKQLFFTGFWMGLSLMTKAYFLPIVLAYIVFLLFKRISKLAVFLYGLLLSTLLTLIPSLIFAKDEFIRDVFIYSLTRSQGIPKKEIIWFFLTHDFPFVILLLFNILTIKKNLFFGLVSLFSTLFFLIYKDTYYLYLNEVTPFLALSFSFFYLYLNKTFHLQKMFIPTIMLFFIFYNLFSYLTKFADLQSLKSIDTIVSNIKQERPKTIYGVNSVTPALAYLSNTPLLHNIVDTNDNIFRKGFLNATQLTKDAISQQSIIVTEGAFYPEFSIREDVLTEIVDKKLLEQHCSLIASYPFKAEGFINRINLFRC